MLLHELIEREAERDPRATAVAHGDRVVSFGELAGLVARCSDVVERVTEPGGRVAVAGENHLGWVECYYGVPRAGRVLVFLNPRHTAAEMARALEHSGASLLVGEERLVAPLACSGQFDHPVLSWDDLEREVQSARESLPGEWAAPGATAWLIYTSGTTGLPKGAMLTHSSLMAAVEATAACRPAAPDDVYVFAFPLCHVAGYNLLNHHAHGRPVVLLPRFDPGWFADAVAAHAATTTSLAATMLRDLLEYVEAGEVRLGSLRSIAYGAAPMPAALMRRAHELLGVDLAQGYGMTELSGNAVFLDAADHRRGLAGEDGLLLSAGRPAPGVSLRIADDQGKEVPRGEPGEILVRGNQVMAGYWEDPAGTEEALRGGWLHTGDVGRVDEEGYLYVVDRLKDVIVTGGENVSSREVEEVLHADPGVREVAVVGVPDTRWGENVCAVVVPRDGVTLVPSELARAAAIRLAGYKKPRHVVIAQTSLPKTSSGKIRKAEVRRWLEDNPELVGPRL